MPVLCLLSPRTLAARRVLHSTMVPLYKVEYNTVPSYKELADQRLKIHHCSLTILEDYSLYPSSKVTK